MTHIQQTLRAITVIIVFGFGLAGNANDFGPAQPYDKLSSVVVTPHIPFARPYAGGNVKALVIAPCWTQRDTVELAQRLSLDYTPLMTESYEAFGPFQSDFKRATYMEGSHDQFNDVVQSRLLADVKYDVIIIGRMGWTNAFPEAARSAILNKVRNGAGLVYIAPAQLNPDLEQAVKEDAPDLNAITYGIPMNAVPALKDAKIRAGKLGKGRLVFISYAEIKPKPNQGYDWNMAKRHQMESLTPYFVVSNDYDHVQYEYSCALLTRATLWASGREATVLFQGLDMQPRKIQRNELSSAKISFSLAGIPAASRLEYVIRDSLGRVEFSKSQDAKQGENTLPLSLLRKGEKVVDIWLKDSSGKVINWASCPLTVLAPVGIESVAVDQEIYQKGEAVKGEVILTDGSYEKLSLQVSARDSYGREVARLSLPVKEKRTAFDFQVSDPLASAFKLEVTLKEGKESLDMKEKPFYINHIGWAPVDDFILSMWSDAWSGGHSTKIYLDRMAASGVDVIYNAGALYEDYNKAREVALRLARANLKASLYATRLLLVDAKHPWSAPVMTNGDPAIKNCPLSATPEGFKHLKELAKAYGPLSPAYYSLGDENAISFPPEDVCFCTKCLESFRAMMKKTYKDLAALNAEWGTNYKDWGEVKPITLVNAQKEKRYPQWVDHRVHMDERFTGLHVAAVKAIQGVDPNARVGIEGPVYPSSSFTGFNLYRMVAQFRFFGPYGALPEAHVFSYLQPDSISGTWYGSYQGVTIDGTRYHPWHCLFKGMNSAMWWTSGLGGNSGLGGSAIFSPDYASLPIFEATCEEIREIKSGIGKLLLASQRHTDAIAVYLSNYCLHASTIRPKESTWNKSLNDFHFMLMDAGYEYQYLSPDDLQAGKIGKFKVLMLPYSQAISAQDVEVMRNFVKKGGLLIADFVPGIMDEHTKMLEKSSLIDVFGEFGRMHIQEYSKGKAVCLGDFAGGYADKRKNGEGKGVPSGAIRLLTDLGGVKPFARVVGQDGEVRQDIEISVFHHGKAAYLCLLRGPVAKKAAAATTGPEVVGSGGVAVEEMSDIQVQLPAQYHVYDMRGKQYLNCVEGFKARIEPVQAKVFALLPAQLEKMEIKAGKKRYRGGDKVKYEVRLNPSALKGCGLAVRVEVFGPGGKIMPWYTKKIVSQQGEFAGEIPLSLNELAGKYRLVAYDIVGGASIETAFDVKW